MKILVINLGSTTTKLALFLNDESVWERTIGHPVPELSAFHHINEQYEYRRSCMIRVLDENDISMDFDAIIARGGLLKPTSGGVYQIDEKIKHDLWYADMEHASNLAAFLADYLASQIGCPAFIADPVVTDELREEARLTGIPEIPRLSIFHALNSRAVSRRYAASIGKKYEEMYLVVVHMGGGISVSAHQLGRVVDVNNALNGEGPFSPERAGTIPARQLVDLCYSGKYTQKEMCKLLNGKGGLMAYLGTTDIPSVVERINQGDVLCKRVVDAMLYTVAKQVGAMHIALTGKTDAVILTGGIAYSNYCVELLRKWLEPMLHVIVIPGQNEMWALAINALSALKGEIPIQKYKG